MVHAGMRCCWLCGPSSPRISPAGVLSFDRDAADVYAEIAAVRKKAGKPISQFDAMIAAVVRSRGACLATRNTRDFVDCGIELVDPWLT
jgi:predicted nucleic acid-binding protein